MQTGLTPSNTANRALLFPIGTILFTCTELARLESEALQRLQMHRMEFKLT